MSWMDSWSRPTKHAITPPPLYLTASGEDVPYCHSCGRLIGSRRSEKVKDAKYCSPRCRNTKPGPIDRKIEATFAALLKGEIPEDIAADPQAKEALAELKEKEKNRKQVKGDKRIIVECSDVEALLFHHEKDPEKVYGRKKNRATRALGKQEKPEDWKSVDMVDGAPPKAASLTDGEGDMTVSDASTFEDDGVAEAVAEAVGESSTGEYGFGAGKVRPPQEQTELNFSAMGGERGWAEKIEETEEMKAKRLEGQRRAKEKEMVRSAARRGCAFGFMVSEEEALEGKEGKEGKKAQKSKKAEPEGKGVEHRRKCEAIMKSAAVEASYAKGEWGIRWREKV